VSLWSYTVFSEQYESLDLSGYTGYGIAVATPEGEISVADIFTNYNKTVEIAALFTRVQLSPLHIWDAVEDAIAQ